MEKWGKDILRNALAVLRKREKKETTAFLGFDACIDNIVRVVKEKEENGNFHFFDTGSQFAEYIISHGDKSCGIELSTRISKLGGNMVITANALGNLGIKTDCAGTFGMPDILPFFRGMSPGCNLHTIGETITATALEFSNSKVILFDPGPYNDLSWNSIIKILDRGKLINLVKDKDLISFLNWSEIGRSSEIWEGFLDEIFPGNLPEASGKPFFTDLSDCSRKTKEEIVNGTKLLKRFRRYFKVTLSLNHNEADLVASAHGISHNGNDKTFIETLYNACGTDILVIHRIEDAIGFDGIKVKSFRTFLTSDPVILTGGGDNFNAGFCLALLAGLSLSECLAVANGVAGYYVRYGSSPNMDQMTEFLRLNSEL